MSIVDSGAHQSRRAIASKKNRQRGKKKCGPLLALARYVATIGVVTRIVAPEEQQSVGHDLDMVHSAKKGYSDKGYGFAQMQRIVRVVKKRERVGFGDIAS